MRKTTNRIALATVAIAGIAGIRGLYAQPAAVVGDAERGAPLFSDKYNCYACHGFDAQSGERRLIPMNYPLEGFITFVQNSPLPNMPRFPDASPQELADIWAYIKTVEVDAPAIDDLPALREIRDKQQASLGK
jgi:mono/diheme cytochrome c family protein